MEKKKIGIMISGSGTNMQAIVNACETEEINAEVMFVAADTVRASGLMWAHDKKIPTFVVHHVHYRQKVVDAQKNNLDLFGLLPGELDYYDLAEKGKNLPPKKMVIANERFLWFLPKILAEEELLRKMWKYDIDLLVLAGYMRVMTPYIIDQLNENAPIPRIMNIHPALLPAFPGTDGYGDTVRYGCRYGGCTVHFVDYGEDTGPIIDQTAIPILPDDDVDSFRKKGLQEEYKLYPRCIELFATDKIRIVENEFHRKIVEILE